MWVCGLFCIFMHILEKTVDTDVKLCYTDETVC